MRSNTRVEQLLEEVVASGRTPEEVCHGELELLPAVLEDLRRLRAIEAEIAAIFPASGPSPADVDAARSTNRGRLPDVPGYTVLRVLGRGGMGVVYAAQHLKLTRTVAIKMLLTGRFASPAELARFTREAQAIAGLRHPHIVQVYDIGDLNGQPYFTMEYVEGGSLAQKLAGMPQTPTDAASMIATLADAVQVAHDGGIIHRDLKPANILLTADGTPKVSDFGLARRYDDGSDLTIGGARLGTPSYMSPEQAIGKDGTIGPATDVYSLGAVLYEMLTGRPPFRGDSAADTERQLVRDDPTPPRLLNPRIPRDLEVICLTCLSKAPGSRYVSARDLADDLRRYLAGEPIAARPVGRVERIAKWVRRSPARAALTAACIIAVLAGGVASTWALSARASLIAAVEADLALGMQYEQSGDWRDASAAIDRAAVRLGGANVARLRAQIDRTKADLALVARLDSIRLMRAGSSGGVLNNAPADAAYAAAFRSADLGWLDDAPAAVAARIARSPISQALIGALDDWAQATRDDKRRAWIVDVARLSDHADDPEGWRSKARDPAEWTSNAAIARLAELAPVEKQPVTFLYVFSEAMGVAGVDNLPFLSRAQRAHPDDFWLTTALAYSYKLKGRHEDAVSYFRAAVALRPDAMASHYNLGRELGEVGRYEESVVWLRTALKADPGALDALKCLGLSFSKMGRTGEAVEIFENALTKDPNDWLVHLHVSVCYAKLGRVQNACDSYRRALTLGPADWSDRATTRDLLLKQGHQELASSLWQQQLATKTSALGDWDSYAELSLFVSDVAGYQHARDELLDRFGKATDPNACERLGRACLLLPPTSPAQFQRISALIDRALASEDTTRNWAYPYFRFARAMVDLRAGDYAAALAIVEGDSAGVLGPAPKLVASICKARMGEQSEAQRRLAEASLAFDWTPAAADNREAWIYHVLRREAEQLVFPELDSLVRGRSQPDDQDALLCLIAACKARNRFGRCAELCSSMLLPDSPVPDRIADAAARHLVAAGTGLGTDAAEYSDADRVAWRQAALTLLTTRIDDWERQVRAGTRNAADTAAVVTAWQTAREFDAVRGDPPSASLPEAERLRWRSLWSRSLALANQAKPVKS